MLIIGLTGSIGMGKTTVASQLAACGVKVCNADTIVHKLLAKGGGAVQKVAERFPGSLHAGAIDRKALGDRIFANPHERKALESILHPLVAQEEKRFIRAERRKGVRMAVIEIPLLFEVGAEKRCDRVLLVSAPAYLQRQRVMKRPGMTEAKFKAILAAQMPDREKRRRADAIIPTGLGKAHSFRALKNALGECYAAGNCTRHGDYRA